MVTGLTVDDAARSTPTTRGRTLRRNAGDGCTRALLACAVLAVCSYAHAATALIADRLIDGRSDAVRRNAVVLVDGGRIVAVGDRSIIPKGAERIELGDATLMPA